MKYSLFLVLLTLFLFSENVSAQTQNSDFIRSTGKIYVVVTVLTVILIGIFAFLIYLERRINKLENLVGSE
jgi:hypothetical protein